MSSAIGGRTSRQILSLSNASLDLYPDNSRTQFTHHLPQRLQFKPGTIVQVALTQVVISGDLDETAYDEDRTISYVKVHLKQLSPQTVPNNSEVRLLARIPFKPGASTYIYKPDTPVFLPLIDCSHLDELTYIITDERDIPLKLADGQPTGVQIEMETSRERGAFSVSVNANVSKDLYPDNTLAEWRSEFPHSLNLDSGWEVCLHSVQVPKAVQITDSAGSVTLYRYNDSYPAIGLTSMLNELTPEKTWNYHDFTPFLRRFGLDVQTTASGKIAVTRARHLTFAQRQRANIDRDVPSSYVARMTLDPVLCFMLNLQHDPKDGLTFHFPEDVNDSRTEVVIREAVKDRRGKLKEDYRERFMTDGRAEQLAVYADLVESSIVGNAIGPILDIVPTKELSIYSTTEDVFYPLANPIYRGVNPQAGKTLCVKLTRLDGRVPPMAYAEEYDETEREPITLNLVFRRRGRRER